jgi:hypothetical protein
MKRALPALISSLLQAQGLPQGLELPPGLELKPGSVQAVSFDRELFDVAGPKAGTVVKIPVEGRTWRFLLRSSEGRPLGALTLSERFRTGLDPSWAWEWRERLVAKRTVDGRELWLRAQPGGSGEMRVAVVERGLPRQLEFKEPSLLPELPKGTEDFPYLPPWPGAKLSGSAVSRSPVDAKFPDGAEQIALVNWIDKEYALPQPPSAHEFMVVYRSALIRAGWEIEGSIQSATTQIQAAYRQRGRDLRATLRLMGDAMGISVADVGAQLRGSGPRPK